MDEQPLRIAVLGTRGFPNVQGGVERHCENLYPRLVRLGCRVRVYTRKSYGDPSRSTYEGVERYPLWAPRSKSLEAIVHTFLGMMHLFFQKKAFDILHIHAIGPSLLTPLARLYGIRVVVTNHGPEYDRQKWGTVAKLVLRLGERWSTKYAHAVISVARHIQVRLEREFKRTIYYIPNGIPVLRRQTLCDLALRFGLEKGRYILAIGRLVPEKGFHDLIAAFKNISTDWKLVIVGKADHESDYSTTLVKHAQEDKRVILTGILTGRSLEEVYSHAGMFVIPSYHEGLPLTLLEALSYDLPIVASDIPANREIIGDKPRAFSPGDVNGLAVLISSEICDREVGSSALGVDRSVLAEYEWERIAEKTLSIYKEVATS